MTPQSCTEHVQLWGDNKAVLAQRLDAFFREQAVGGSHIPGGEGVRGGVCLCYQSPAAKSY